MRKYPTRRWFISLFLLALPSLSPGAEDRARGIDFFEQKIRPVLVKRCYRCHSAKAASNKRLKANLYLDSRAGMHKGGDTGPAVVPGKVGKSLLIQAIRHENEAFAMPPSRKLPDEVIADFVRWVKMGAPDPRDGKLARKKYEIDIEAGRRFWSFKPLQKHQPPQVKDKGWARGDVDCFVLARLESSGLKPTGDADARLLVRRLFFDLIGLPPTPEQIETFRRAANQSRQSAIENLVDQLLASPRFGERWGRHWLDVARYGESNGGTKNTVWPDGWRYRDYVIDSFNKDRPYHQFVREQLAGDLLPADNASQRRQQIIATGFLAMGSKAANALRMEVIGEQLDVVGRAFLGISIGCARCHDHKFDPIPTSDFYSMAGILLNTQIQDGKPFAALNDFQKSDKKQSKNFQRALSSATRNIERSLDRLEELTKQGDVRRWPGQPWTEVLSQLSSGQRSKAESTFKQLQKAQAELEELRRKGPPEILECVAVTDRPAKGRNFLNARIHIRGSEQNLGKEVPRTVMQVLCEGKPPTVGERQSGRLQLAEVIYQHPLTARVMVNRIWHHLFGRGLVRTVDNFGTLGDRPSHPELLDWLAVRFTQEQWSVKRMIRRIVLSRTYQLAADAPPDLEQRAQRMDPDNVLLWRHSPRRRDAESIRDAILNASGMLDLTPPTRFDSLAYVSQMADITAMDRINKRAVYLPVNRGFPTDVMAVLNFPPADLVVGQRETPSVPTQALFLLNSPLVIRHSQRLALRLLNDKNLNDTRRVDQACLLTWGRPASTDEQREALAFITQHQKLNKDASERWRQLDAWSAYCQSLFCAAEFRFIR